MRAHNRAYQEMLKSTESGKIDSIHVCKNRLCGSQREIKAKLNRSMKSSAMESNSLYNIKRLLSA